MRIAVITETDKLEGRVAATPETVKKLIALGAPSSFRPVPGLSQAWWTPITKRLARRWLLRRRKPWPAPTSFSRSAAPTPPN